MMNWTEIEKEFDEKWFSNQQEIRLDDIKSFFRQKLEEQNREFVKDLSVGVITRQYIDSLITKYSTPPNPKEEI
jgi:hypothetical protein